MSKINVVLFEPEIPYNTGNIIRSCIGMNADLFLIEPLGFTLDDKNLKRAGVNYLDKCNITIYKSLDEFFSKEKGAFFFFTRYGHVPPSSYNFKDVSENIYFFFGKESTGLPYDLLKKHLKHCFRVPTNKDFRALNLSNTVAIALYELYRQLDYDGLSMDEGIKESDFIEKA